MDLRVLVRNRSLLGLAALMLLAAQAGKASQASPNQPSTAGDIFIAVAPALPYIEVRDSEQRINLDFLVQNRGNRAMRLAAIKLKVFDTAGRLQAAKEVNENGNPPALSGIGKLGVEPGETIDIYSPFYSFGKDISLDRLQFQFFFMSGERRSAPVPFTADQVVTLQVKPRAYNPTAFCLPIAGRSLVHDGHDFYSHHRRYDLSERYKRDVALALSRNLYAYDFVYINEEGNLFSGDPTLSRSWFSYAAPVIAPASGIVIEALDILPDNTLNLDWSVTHPPEVADLDPHNLGNHLKIRHDDGRVSWLMHLRKGSLRVKTGDKIRRGERLADVGFSGDALFPHLHYTVTLSPGNISQGVPSYFSDFERRVDGRVMTVPHGQIDTGDIVQNGPGGCHT